MNDLEVKNLIEREDKRQKESLCLIASENIVSDDVREALGSTLTNKYAEGYPSKRYYAGNEVIDEIENVAIERLCKLFNSKFANVQPHSGSPANMAVYFALMEYNDKFMGLDLSHGGHLTHGSPVNFSGKLYKPVHYQVKKDGYLDYDEIEKIAKQEKPKLIQCGYTAYPRLIDFKRFREIADSVDAYLMCDVAHTAGLIAGKALPSPVEFADVVTFTTHKTLRGPRGGAIIWNNEDLTKKINSSIFPGLQGGPHENTIAAKAVCFKEAMTTEFQNYSKKVIQNAQVLAEELKNKDYNLVSNGTDTHLILIDLHNKEITGKQAQNWLEESNIICNRNTVPYDDKSPFVTSGIRLGTPTLTTRGLNEQNMREVAELIDEVIKNNGKNIKEKVIDYSSKFPIFKF
jgi:glycine hydroxymethyltransferase